MLAVVAGVVCVGAGVWQAMASGLPVGPARTRAIAEAWSLAGTGAAAVVAGVVLQAGAAGLRMLAELRDAVRDIRGKAVEP